MMVYENVHTCIGYEKHSRQLTFNNCVELLKQKKLICSSSSVLGRWMEGPLQITKT